MMKLKLGFRKDYSTNNKLVFYTEIKKERNTHIKYYSLNPLVYIKSWITDIKWFFTKKYYTYKKEEYKLCQGCGEGISKYRIKDPNKKYNTKIKFNCCSKCVSFYDWHASAREIIGWKIKYDLLDDNTITRVIPILKRKRRLTNKEKEEIDTLFNKLVGDGL